MTDHKLRPSPVARSLPSREALRQWCIDEADRIDAIVVAKRLADKRLHPERYPRMPDIEPDMCRVNFYPSGWGDAATGEGLHCTLTRSHFIPLDHQAESCGQVWTSARRALPAGPNGKAK